MSLKTGSALDPRLTVPLAGTDRGDLEVNPEQTASAQQAGASPPARAVSTDVDSLTLAGEASSRITQSEQFVPPPAPPPQSGGLVDRQEQTHSLAVGLQGVLDAVNLEIATPTTSVENLATDMLFAAFLKLNIQNGAQETENQQDLASILNDLNWKAMDNARQKAMLAEQLSLEAQAAQLLAQSFAARQKSSQAATTVNKSSAKTGTTAGQNGAEPITTVNKSSAKTGTTAGQSGAEPITTVYKSNARTSTAVGQSDAEPTTTAYKADTQASTTPGNTGGSQANTTPGNKSGSQANTTPGNKSGSQASTTPGNNGGSQASTAAARVLDQLRAEALEKQEAARDEMNTVLAEQPVKPRAPAPSDDPTQTEIGVQADEDDLPLKTASRLQTALAVAIKALKQIGGEQGASTMEHAVPEVVRLTILQELEAAGISHAEQLAETMAADLKSVLSSNPAWIPSDQAGPVTMALGEELEQDRTPAPRDTREQVVKSLQSAIDLASESVKPRVLRG